MSEFKVNDEIEQAFRQGKNSVIGVTREQFTEACEKIYDDISKQAKNDVSMARLFEFTDIIDRLDKELFGDEEHK